MPAFQIHLEVSYGDTVTEEQIVAAVHRVRAALDQIIEPFMTISFENHSDHHALRWVWQVEAEQRFEVQYMEKALDNLIRVALHGVVVRVTTSSQPVEHAPA